MNYYIFLTGGDIVAESLFEDAVRISDMNSRGLGIAKVDGKVIFVKGAVTGDVCRIAVVNEEKNYSIAEATEYISLSPLRVSPDCPQYGRCGGCSLRHVSFGAENDIKKATVEAALRRFGLSDVRVNDTLFGHPDGYRNKAVFRAGESGEVGYFEKETNRLVPLSEGDCRTVPAGFVGAARDIEDAFARSGIRTREIMLRISTADEIHATVSVEKGQDVEALSVLARPVGGVVSLGVTSDGGKNVVQVYGSPEIVNRLFGLELSVSPASFFQVNYEGASLLFGAVLSAVENISFTVCADLFCGTGVWGLAMASRYPGRRFYGVDSCAEAIADAKKNAEANGVRNIEFFCGDAAEDYGAGRPDLVVLDPPRAGCSDGMIKALLKLRPDNIVYVSCDPFTLARDLRKLTGEGYRATEATPVNMFPRTEHVETVVRLSRQ